MINIQNKDLQPILATLLVYDKNTNQEIGGILTEELGMGLRRKLQKIRKDALSKFEELQKDTQDITKSFDERVYSKLDQSKNIEDYKSAEKDSKEMNDWISGYREFESELKKEFLELLDEEVKIDQEKAMASELEKINSKANYNWDILEKITE